MPLCLLAGTVFAAMCLSERLYALNAYHNTGRQPSPVNKDAKKSCEITTNQSQEGEGTWLTSQRLCEMNQSQHEMSGATWVKRTQFLRNTALESGVRKIHFHGPMLFYKN